MILLSGVSPPKAPTPSDSGRTQDYAAINSNQTPLPAQLTRREAFYKRPYSGEKLCRRCFLKSIGDKVRVTISKHNMFEMNDRIAVAVSGGKDSVSLLHILAEIEEDFPKSAICVITVDEGIGRYGDEAAPPGGVLR